MTKKIGIGSILSIASAALFIVALILFEVSMGTAQGYFDGNQNGAFIALLLIAVVCGIGSAVLKFIEIPALAQKTQEMLAFILAVVACLCGGYAIGLVIGAIATEFAYTYFSDFNVGTIKEQFIPTALTQALASIVLLIVSIIVSAVANAFGERK